MVDLKGVDRFRISLHIMACFESGAACNQEIVVLNNTLVPQKMCDMSLGTSIKGTVVNGSRC